MISPATGTVPFVQLLPLSFSTNRDYLRRWLVFNSLQVQDSGLTGVADTIGGERLTLRRGSITRDFAWNPIAIAQHKGFEDPEESAKELRSTVQSTIDAWASCYDRVTHQLSGGLDSSIVAGCLSQCPSKPRVDYLNFSADIGFDAEPLHIPGLDKKFAEKIRAISGTGDERYFARLVADRWKVPLIELQRNGTMDLSRLWDAPLMTSPPLLYTSLELDDAKVEMADRHGTQAFFSGLAGDSAFLATIQPLSAIDYAYVHGITSDLWQHVRATAALSKSSIWTVIPKAIRHGRFRRPYHTPVKVLASATLLSKETISGLKEEDFCGFWQEFAHGLPPGKQLHLAGITGPAYHDYIFASGRYADHVEPLHSQPISELMLQIPTYTALTGGVSRGLARRAFADLLPDEIRRRQTKGTGNPFYQHIVRRNVHALREHLLEGRLISDGYLDKAQLSACLSSKEPVFTTVQASQLLSYLSAELSITHNLASV